MLIVHEDSRTGGVGESLAAIIQEEAFEWLDAPVRIVGALDTPVPYSPPLEDFFLPSEAEIERAARLLVGLLNMRARERPVEIERLRPFSPVLESRATCCVVSPSVLSRTPAGSPFEDEPSVLRPVASRSPTFGQ